jgi:imidazoleglycerol-phosphate dehydratase/histidinol-phosphatase
MKKVLFIDRDGTLIIEPPTDYQVDSLEKLEFYPQVFRYLSMIAEELDYELVMVTNQDGLGTSSFPEEAFWPAHNKMINAFAKEGIRFSDILIDRSLPVDNAPTRKPGTAMLSRYFTGEYDLSRSFVIGDRITDVQLAQNLGANAIYLGNELQASAILSTTSWKDIYQFLKKLNRTSNTVRKTTETNIEAQVNLDGNGLYNIKTGVGFFDHMLEQVAKHSSIDISIVVNGDLHIDEHHTIEDTGLVLGTAIKEALGKKTGIERYGFLLPMDDCLAQVAIDFSGRPWLVWDAPFLREKIGDMPTEMLFHFFKSFSDAAGCNLNITATGNNEHHKAEAIFKGFAKAMKMAVKQTGAQTIPSTKGSI